MNKKFFLATKALIEFEGKILIIRESVKYKDGAQVGKYDVPGGRLKPGEDPERSLKREIKEETGIDVEIKDPFFVNEVKNIVNNEEWLIKRTFYRCSSKSNKIKLSQDHDDFKWIDHRGYKKHGLIENLHAVFEAYSNK